MRPLPGRRPTACALVLAVILALISGAAAAPAVPCPAPVRVTYANHPFSRVAHAFREKTFTHTRGHEGRNVAVAFVDVTGIEGIRPRGKGTAVRDVKELAAEDPELLKALAPRPGVERILIVTKSNDPADLKKPKEQRRWEKPRDHSEVRILDFLTKNAVPHDRMLALYSDRSPCPTCAPRIPPCTPVFYVTRNGTERRGKGEPSASEDMGRALDSMRGAKNGRREGAEEQREEAGRGEAGADGSAAPAAAAPRLLADPAAAPPCRPAAPAGQVLAARRCDPQAPSGGFYEELSKARTEQGGIDFSTLELRYVSDGAAGRGLAYAFRADAAPEDAPPPETPDAGLREAQEASDAFFVWLRLPPHKQTVNLSPVEPDRIIDPGLGRTDAGRILLEADLELKRTVGRLIHPDSRLGPAFWGSLRGRCISFRQWIVPAPATVRDDGDALHILDAPLSVRMETEYLEGRNAADVTSSCREQSPEIEAHNADVFRRTVLPELARQVRTAPEYASLRRIYHSRVAAEWYRLRAARGPAPFADLVDREDLTHLAARRPRDPKDVFRQYVESYTRGEFDVTRSRAATGGTSDVRHYVFGGVDFSRIAFRRLGAADFRGRHGERADTVATALAHATADTDGGSGVWLGGTTPGAYRPVPVPGFGRILLNGLPGGPATLAMAAVLVLLLSARPIRPADHRPPRRPSHRPSRPRP
ncbi:MULTISPECIES: hypothetical protein [unclassified Streptomyces]|uniref:hypothetical protein n=1 Tax=unclassified Streptomyces TaxID=2593676 RepID=UPI0029A60916|nr:hypothetical protein [Streptomyces sp. DK15]MDX2391603.1 hypothetical protein [Streptomyces sp. DK15]